MNNKITIVPKKKESDGSNKSITITKKQIQKGAEGVISDQLPPETFAKIYHFDGVKISHFLQQTAANCGPLSIINVLTALKALHPELNFGPRFPHTSNGIRKLLSERADLRTDFSGTAESNQIINSNYLLASTHIFNVLNELQKNLSYTLYLRPF